MFEATEAYFLWKNEHCVFHNPYTPLGWGVSILAATSLHVKSTYS